MLCEGWIPSLARIYGWIAHRTDLKPIRIPSSPHAQISKRQVGDPTVDALEGRNYLSRSSEEEGWEFLIEWNRGLELGVLVNSFF